MCVMLVYERQIFWQDYIVWNAHVLSAHVLSVSSQQGLLHSHHRIEGRPIERCAPQ